MNHHQESPSFYLPALLFVAAINCYLIFQVLLVSQTTFNLQLQESRITAQDQAARSKLAAARATQNLLKGLANDVLALGKTDPDFRRIVDKYQIKRTEPQ